MRPHTGDPILGLRLLGPIPKTVKKWGSGTKVPLSGSPSPRGPILGLRPRGLFFNKLEKWGTMPVAPFYDFTQIAAEVFYGLFKL